MQKRVTGLIITDTNKITIGLSLKKRIKSMVYKKIKKNEGDIVEIRGYLAFLNDIEPEYYNKLIIKYSRDGYLFDLLG